MSTVSPSFSERQTTHPTGIVIVDDHPAVLSGVAALLGGEPGMEVLGTADSEAQALNLAERLGPDAAVIDFHLAGENGLDLALRLSMLEHAPKVVIYSAFPGPALVAASCVAGACAVVAKHGLAHELPDAIRAARAGRRTVPRLSRTELSALSERLQPEDRSLLAMFSRGMSAEQVAETLSIDEADLHARRRRTLHALTDRSHSALSAMKGSALHYSPSRGAG